MQTKRACTARTTTARLKGTHLDPTAFIIHYALLSYHKEEYLYAHTPDTTTAYHQPDPPSILAGAVFDRRLTPSRRNVATAAIIDCRLAPTSCSPLESSNAPSRVQTSKYWLSILLIRLLVRPLNS